jgi:hypothetical protein
MFTDTPIWHEHPTLASDMLFDELPVGGRSVARHWTRDRPAPNLCDTADLTVVLARRLYPLYFRP